MSHGRFWKAAKKTASIESIINLYCFHTSDALPLRPNMRKALVEASRFPPTRWEILASWRLLRMRVYSDERRFKRWFFIFFQRFTSFCCDCVIKDRCWFLGEGEHFAKSKMYFSEIYYILEEFISCSWKVTFCNDMKFNYINSKQAFFLITSLNPSSIFSLSGEVFCFSNYKILNLQH